MVSRESRPQLARDFVLVEAFDGGDFGVFASDGEGDARAYRRAVDKERAGAADAVLAADMGAGKVVRLAQQVSEMRARLDLGAQRAAVDRQADLAHRPAARSTARRRATTCVWRSSGSFMPAEARQFVSRLGIEAFGRAVGDNGGGRRR